MTDSSHIPCSAMSDSNSILKDYVSVVISICAFFLTMYQARATWKHNRLTVHPRLTTFTNIEHNLENPAITIVTVLLMNNGLGPAIIKSFELLLDGKAKPVSEPEEMHRLAMETLKSDLVTAECHFAVLRKAHSISKDAEVRLVKLAIKNATAEQLKEFKRFHVRICYESAYGESFTYDSRTHKGEI